MMTISDSIASSQSLPLLFCSAFELVFGSLSLRPEVKAKPGSEAE